MNDRKYKHPQVNLRLPEEIKDRIVELAEFNGRSANAEMVAALEAWTMKNKHLQPIDLASIYEKVSNLEKEVELLKEISHIPT